MKNPWIGLLHCRLVQHNCEHYNTFWAIQAHNAKRLNFGALDKKFGKYMQLWLCCIAAYWLSIMKRSAKEGYCITHSSMQLVVIAFDAFTGNIFCSICSIITAIEFWMHLKNSFTQQTTANLQHTTAWCNQLISSLQQFSELSKKQDLPVSTLW